MPELTHDTAEDGFHEIQLSGKQLVFLFMVTTALSVAIFLCGVLVGRGARAERGETPIDTAAVVPSGPPTAVREPASPGTQAPPTPSDGLVYHGELTKEAKPEQKLKPRAQEPPPVAAPPPVPSKPAAAAAVERGPNVPTSGRRGTWFIQLHALQNRATAGARVEKLIAQGYPAYLELPAAGAPPIYRVRVGRFDDRREAEQVARRLEKEQQFKPDIRR